MMASYVKIGLAAAGLVPGYLAVESAQDMELADLKMEPNRNGPLPKNSRYTRVEEEDSDGYLVTAPNAVYLWEDDANGKKISCDIESTMD
jgi:hypothetical protein